MRALLYPFESNQATLYDAYGNKRGEIPLQKGGNTLPCTQERYYYRDSFGNVFFVYEGEKELLWEDAQRSFNFRGLSIITLDSTLQGEQRDAKALKWIEVYEKNLQKGYEYLCPPHFKELETKLLALA